MLLQFGFEAAAFRLRLAELAGQVLVSVFKVFDVAQSVLVGGKAAGHALEHKIPGRARGRSDFPHHALELLFHIAALGIIEIAQLHALGERGGKRGVERIAVWKVVGQAAVELENDFRAGRALESANFEPDLVSGEVQTKNPDLIANFEPDCTGGGSLLMPDVASHDENVLLLQKDRHF